MYVCKLVCMFARICVCLFVCFHVNVYERSPADEKEAIKSLMLLTLKPVIYAAVYSDSDNTYIPNVELLFASLGVVGFFVGLYMNYYDVRHHSVLNRPGSTICFFSIE